MCALTDIISLIKASKNILIIAHIQPDGDTLGSCFALDIMLKKLGKHSDIYCEDGIPHRYAEIFPKENISVLKEKDFDLAIAVDCADKARLGKAQKIFMSTNNNINIDHHITNEKFGKLNHISEASSAGEIIFELMNAAGVEQDELSARYIYTAMSTDTGNFTYSNTGRKCLLYASELVELFDIRETADILFRRRTLVLTQLIARALTRLELFDEGKIACVTLLKSDMKEYGASGSDCENIVDFAREIEETKIAVFFREIKNGVKISLRSKGDIDVGSVAVSFGGGGHPNAAGCYINGNLEKAKNNLINILKELVL
jgi:phosphoesterase RecJ-like protein